VVRAPCGRSADPHQLSRLARERDTVQAMSATRTTQKWICESCGFIYDPLDGDPDGGIPPGTAFEDIPETWFCPVCGARKRDFVPHED
jgi:rubredoxin